jgi:type VI secretion system protein ImpA
MTGELLELESMAKLVYPTNSDGKRIADDFNQQEPDWPKLETRCFDLLKATRDLRVAVYYTAALLRVRGFAGLAYGLEVARKMLVASEYQLYPQVEAGDSGAFVERWYTLVALGAPYKQDGDLLRIIEGVRNVSLGKSKSSSCHYHEVIIARNQSGGPDLQAIERIRNEWKKVPADERKEATTSLAAALNALAKIESFLLEQTPENLIPPGASAKPLQGLVLELKGLLDFLSGSVFQSNQPKAAVATAEVQLAVPGEISSRTDAIRLLQQVAEFFRKTEPASPIPYFVDRAVRLVDRDFMGLLGDLVPDAVPKFQSLAGVENNPTV